jgi:signal transduction histidine kinase
MPTRIAFVALIAAVLIAAPSAQLQRRSQEANNSAILSERAAEAAEAEKLFLRAIAIRERAAGPSDAIVAMIINISA